MSLLRYAPALLVPMALSAGVAVADPVADCRATPDPLAARICLINREVARLEAGLEASACGTVGTMDGAQPQCDGSLRLSTSGPNTPITGGLVTAYPQVANEGFTADQQLTSVRARQSLLQTADARVAAGGVAATDNRAFLLIPLLLLLLLLSGGGNGSGEPMSPS